MLILAYDRRKIVRFDVTQHPTAGWLSRQVTEAFPWDTAPRFLLHDRDSSHGSIFRKRLEAMGISEVVTAPRSPQQFNTTTSMGRLTLNVVLSQNLKPHVLMMEPCKDWNRGDAADLLGTAKIWNIFLQ